MHVEQYDIEGITHFVVKSGGTPLFGVGSLDAGYAVIAAITAAGRLDSEERVDALISALWDVSVSPSFCCINDDMSGSQALGIACIYWCARAAAADDADLVGGCRSRAIAAMLRDYHSEPSSETMGR